MRSSQQVAAALATASTSLRHRNRCPLPARSAARSTSRRWSRPTRPAAPGESTFSAGRSTSPPASNADCVSLWSGIVHDGAGQREAFSRLVDGLADVLAYAERKGVDLAFEPEPGMLIDTLGRYDDLLDELAAQRIDALAAPPHDRHRPSPLPGRTPNCRENSCATRDRLANVHIEDMRAGVHEHLMFGEGEIDFPPVIAALAEIGYAGLLSVELSRHSHEGPDGGPPCV